MKINTAENNFRGHGLAKIEIHAINLRESVG